MVNLIADTECVRLKFTERRCHISVIHVMALAICQLVDLQGQERAGQFEGLYVQAPRLKLVF